MSGPPGETHLAPEETGHAMPAARHHDAAAFRRDDTNAGFLHPLLRVWGKGINQSVRPGVAVNRVPELVCGCPNIGRG